MSGHFPSPERRSFLTRLSAGFAALAATVIAGRATARGQSSTAVHWQPALHEKDDWLDKIPGRHRMVFDTTNHEAFGEAMAFANNFMRVNRSDYGLKDSDLAVVIIARHRSTAFAYNGAMWAKYGTILSMRANFSDPKTKQAAKTNLYNSKEDVELLTGRNTILDDLTRQGIQFGVCQLATRNIAGLIAQATGVTTDAAYSELTANLIGNARMVPAGIVAVGRAQERGYSLVTA